MPQPSRSKILFVSNPEPQCGVHEFGVNIFSHLQRSKAFDFHYAEFSDAVQFGKALLRDRPAAVIYNWHPAVLSWAELAAGFVCPVPSIAVLHEVDTPKANALTATPFDLMLVHEPDLATSNPLIIRAPRPVPSLPSRIAARSACRRQNRRSVWVGSFGFPSLDKGFEDVVEQAQANFEECVVRFQLPASSHDKSSKNSSIEIVDRCRARIIRPGVEVVASFDFLTQDQLLAWLSENDINALLYTSKRGLGGISSAADLALASGRPIALRRGQMFRQFEGSDPSVFVDDLSLSEILANGDRPLQTYKTMWTGERMIEAYEAALAALIEAPRHTSLTRRDACDIAVISLPSSADEPLRSQADVVQLFDTETIRRVQAKTASDLLLDVRRLRPRLVLIDIRGEVPLWLNWALISRLAAPVFALVDGRSAVRNQLPFDGVVSQDSATSLNVSELLTDAARLGSRHEKARLHEAQLSHAVLGALDCQLSSHKVRVDELTERMTELWRAVESYKASAESWQQRVAEIGRALCHTTGALRDATASSESWQHRADELFGALSQTIETANKWRRRADELFNALNDAIARSTSPVDPGHVLRRLPDLLHHAGLDPVEHAGNHGAGGLPDDAEDRDGDQRADGRIGKRIAEPEAERAEDDGERD